MTNLADEKYVALTTYKKDGTFTSAPVWIADTGDGRLGFTTASSSLKVKRLNRDNRVMLQPSNSKGVPTEGTTAVEGTAEVFQGAEFDRVAGIVKAKYKLQYTAITGVGKIAKLFGKGSGTDTAILITLGE